MFNMSEKKPQCLTCRHNLKITSCSPCANKGSKIIEEITSELEDELPITEDKIDTLKYSCKILMNSSEDFDTIDPYNCEYYLSSALKFY